MNTVNQKIIRAVIEKADRVCPDSLALIGVYGSVATGDAYEKSDLDLLILIEDEQGYALATGFILDDRGVGYDLYCTTRESLRYDAECHHAHLSKLMDSQIVYVKNQAAYDELCALREQASAFLTSDERFQRVKELVDQAKICYANACMYDGIGRMRLEASGVISYLLDAVMLCHGTYFKRGVKHTFEELATLPVDPSFVSTILQIATCKDTDELRALTRSLLLYTEAHVQEGRSKAEPSGDLAGTYEEMVSNWRNKVQEAAQNSDPFASFMNLCSLCWMLSDIAGGVQIGDFDVMADYDPDDLEGNVKTFDACLRKYEQVYAKAGLKVNRFANVDEFVKGYLS